MATGQKGEGKRRHVETKTCKMNCGEIQMSVSKEERTKETERAEEEAAKSECSTAAALQIAVAVFVFQPQLPLKGNSDS